MSWRVDRTTQGMNNYKTGGKTNQKEKKWGETMFHGGVGGEKGKKGDSVVSGGKKLDHREYYPP